MARVDVTASPLAWLAILASWTTSSYCAAALRAPPTSAPTSALPRVHPHPRTLPLLALATAEPTFDKPKLDREFFTIAAPAFIQFAAEPLARLVDAYYMGRLGAVALGGAGAAIAAQYAVAKLCNDPLLRSTISLVAAGDSSTQAAADGGGEAPTVRAEPVATALLLALVVGVVQGLLFAFGTGSMLTGMRVGPTSPMRPEACAYLRVCALGAPAATLWLVLNGIFRGLGDTRTPLLWALVFTALNAVLDPFFIFVCGFGAAGAATGTALAQTVACVPLLFALRDKLGLTSLRALLLPRGGLGALAASLRNYLSAAALILARTVAKVSAYTVVGREAARLGAVASAAHILCFQLGVVTTQVCESAAIATQTLLAREMSAARPRPAVARHIVARGLLIGGGAAALLSSATLLARRRVVTGLTTDPAVQAAMVAVLPAVLAAQVLKGAAYPINGALMGSLDWGAAAASMWLAQISCVGAVAIWSRRGALALSLPNLWATFVLLFVVQCVSGLGRILSGTGPWKLLYQEEEASAEQADVSTEAPIS